MDSAYRKVTERIIGDLETNYQVEMEAVKPGEHTNGEEMQERMSRARERTSGGGMLEERGGTEEGVEEQEETCRL
jgi:hypothetical protein